MNGLIDIYRALCSTVEKKSLSSVLDYICQERPMYWVIKQVSIHLKQLKSHSVFSDQIELN